MRRGGPIVTRSFSAVASRPSTPSAPARPPPVSTNRPTVQYQRHHEVEAPRVDGDAFRQGWRVRTRLDHLLEAEKIDDECWQAARTWRGWCAAIGRVGVQGWSPRVDRSLTGYDPHLGKVVAASKLRECTEALGQRRILCLELCVLDDLAWNSVALKLGVSEKTAVLRVAEALEALSDWAAGREVKPPLIERFRNEPRRC
jgi:hypothetical protein